jgi:hypothetical protein
LNSGGKIPPGISLFFFMEKRMLDDVPIQERIKLNINNRLPARKQTHKSARSSFLNERKPAIRPDIPSRDEKMQIGMKKTKYGNYEEIS